MLVHGANLDAKLAHATKYRDATSRTYLAEIKTAYDAWVAANEALVGPGPELNSSDRSLLDQRAKLFREYKEFLDQKHYAEQFDSRSNLHSSVLEEFLYFLFRDLVASFGQHALIGKSHAFKDLFFVPPSYAEMLARPYAQIERKDHDFVIGATVTVAFHSRPPVREDSNTGLIVEATEIPVVEPEEYGVVGIVDGVETMNFDVPAIAIECKTYLDKTMLEGSSRAADEIKARNPNGRYIVVCERLKLSGAVNLKKYSVDQIYILRQERNTDREFRLLPGYEGNSISDDVVAHLFESVRDVLVTDWSVGLDAGISRGWLLE